MVRHSRNRRKPPRERDDRRPATAPAPARTADAGDRGFDVGAGRHDRQRRAADHRAQPGCRPGGFDLGGEFVSDRGDDIAAAVLLAGRHLRLPANLHDRAGGVHRGIAVLRALDLADGAVAVAGTARVRRRRADEREHCPRALHFSALAAWPRHGIQCDGRCDVVGPRPDGGGGSSRWRAGRGCSW